MSSKKKSQGPIDDRLIISETIECDTGKLYDSLPVAIKYLQEIQAAHKGLDVSLSEHWDGYEDMHMEFTYTRRETDAEYAERKHAEHEAKANAERAAKERADHQRKLDAYHKLGRELGIR